MEKSERLGKVIRKSRVRDWPIGYRAGLAISNDAEYLTPSGLTSINSVFAAILGEKKLSTSAFLVNFNPSNPGFALYGPSGPLNIQPILMGFLRDGLIDGIHALVDNDLGNASPTRIKEVVEDLSSKFKFNWWSNHGGTGNRQNIGHQNLANYQEGDLPSSEHYALNFARKLGVNFFALDDNNHVQFRIRRQPIFQKVVARDNSSIVTFQRFRGLKGSPAPTLQSLHEQITPKSVAALLRHRQALIVYQHLGIASRSGRAVHTIVDAESDFPDSAIRTLHMLARASKKGLWIARLSEFLEFVWARENLRVSDSGDTLRLYSLSKRPLSLDHVSVTAEPHHRNVEFVGQFGGNGKKYESDFTYYKKVRYLIFSPLRSEGN